MSSKKVRKPNFNQINHHLQKGITSKKDGQMVCITNGKEVLRLTKEAAKQYFFREVTDEKEKEFLIKNKQPYFLEKDKLFVSDYKGWHYTEKKVYKQYCGHLLNPDKFSLPVFTFETKVKDKDGNFKTIHKTKYI